VATIAAQWRVLGAGFDELNLWDLPGRHVYVHSGGRALTPDLPFEDVRDALAEAVRGGLVQLYDQDDSTHRVLDLVEALALIADEVEWDATSARRRAALAITPLGETASHSVSEQYRRASPFLAVEVADPHFIPPDETDASG
jgi:hypothetical protein